MMNTSKILFALVEKDDEMGREELVRETELHKDSLSSSIFFMLKKKMILVRHIKRDTRPYRKALYRLNPEKANFIIKKLKEEGVDLV